MSNLKKYSDQTFDDIKHVTEEGIDRLSLRQDHRIIPDIPCFEKWHNLSSFQYQPSVRPITKNGEGDVVVMSIDAFEQRERMLEHRAKVLEAELSRLSGEPTYSVGEVRNRLKKKYSHA